MSQKKTHNLKGFKVVDGNITVELSMDRMNRNLNQAQFALDSAVMTSMLPYMPKVSSQFINKTLGESAALAGTGTVVAAAPDEGRFLYMGKTMVDEKTGSTWAEKDGNKVLVSQYRGKTNARENLKYSKHANPKAQSRWFEPAKKADLEAWKKTVKKEMGKE